MKKYIVTLVVIAISLNIQGIGATQEEIDKARDTALGYLGFTKDSELSETIIDDAVEAKKDEVKKRIKQDPTLAEHEIKSDCNDVDIQLNKIRVGIKEVLFSRVMDLTYVNALLDEALYLNPKYLQLYNTSRVATNSLSDAERFVEEQFLKNMKELERYDVSERQKEIDAAREKNL